MQKQGLFCVLALALVLVLSFSASAGNQGILIDIPGTQVHFFTLRYEDATPPYEQADLIWERLSTIFMDWVEQGADPAYLNPDMVAIRKSDANNTSIFLKDNLIVEIDDLHVKLNRANAEHLAKVWADNLRQGIEVFVENNRTIR